MLFGVHAAALHGIALPAMMLLFGEMTDLFVNNAMNVTGEQSS